MRFNCIFYNIRIYSRSQVSVYRTIGPLVHMSHVMRKSKFCLCDNKAADQLYSNCTADQRLFSLLGLYNLSLTINSQNFMPLACFCDCKGRLYRTWSETPKTVFSSRGSYETFKQGYHLCLTIAFGRMLKPIVNNNISEFNTIEAFQKSPLF